MISRPQGAGGRVGRTDQASIAQGGKAADAIVCEAACEHEGLTADRYGSDVRGPIEKKVRVVGIIDIRHIGQHAGGADFEYTYAFGSGRHIHKCPAVDGETGADEAVVAGAGIDERQTRRAGQRGEVEGVCSGGPEQALIVALPGFDRGCRGIEAGQRRRTGAGNLQAVGSAAAVQAIVDGLVAADLQDVVAEAAVDRVGAAAAAQVIGEIGADERIVAGAGVDERKAGDCAKPGKIERIVRTGAEHTLIVALPDLDRRGRSVETAERGRPAAADQDAVASGSAGEPVANAFGPGKSQTRRRRRRHPWRRRRRRH